MTKIINVCIAADNNYKLPLTAVLNSFVKNVKNKTVLHILYTGFSEKYKNKLNRFCCGTNISLDFRDMSKYDFDFHGLDMQHWTRAIFYRIMIPEMFSDLDRMIYLDGDTLVLDDLYELYNTPMDNDFMLGMVVDRFSYKTRIGELKTSNYFNSGMILFDIKKCLEFNFSEKCVQWIYDNPETAKFPDQDAINIIANNKILRINNIYNKQFATNDLIDWSKQYVVAHFLSAIKPWHYNAPSSYSRKYRKYIPNKFSAFRIYVSQKIHELKYFCFHEKYVMKLVNMKIVEQVKFYVFNMCIKTKTLDTKKPNLIDVLQNNKGARKCI